MITDKYYQLIDIITNDIQYCHIEKADNKTYEKLMKAFNTNYNITELTKVEYYQLNRPYTKEEYNLLTKED